MAVPDGRLRPEVDRFEHGGYVVTLIDGDAALAAAGGRRVELLRDAAFPPAVREATLSVTRDPREGTEQYLLDAGARTGPQARPPLSALGGDPVSTLLSWRAKAGDRWATRVVDGMDVVAERVSRWLSPARPAATTDHDPVRVVERVDGDLVATVEYRTTHGGDGQLVALHASVRVAQTSVAHLRAMCRLLIDVVTEVAGPPAGASGITLSPAAPLGDRVTLDQVGGLDEIVGRLREVAVSFRHPDTMARWGARRPQGLLLYGPPGTGKTMLARALANEIGANFQEIHTPDILDKWLGASERNIKAIFSRARRYRQPTVMLFDEFDSIIGYAGEGGDSASQAINAVAGIFKQEMNDLIEANPRVIVVATTNFPDRVDASLTRSGRFDVKLLVPAPDRDGRAEILAKMIRQLAAAHEVTGFVMFAGDVDIDALAARSEGMTGADLAEMLRRAQLAKAMQEARTGTEESAISQADLLHHLTQLRNETTRVKGVPAGRGREG
jgi:transitional endoplasmic reticulum ATPase